jgi:hypothetical protein
LAEREKDPVRRADLKLVIVFANLTGRTDAWKKALEGFDVIKSPTVEEWTKDARAEGQVKGLLAGLEALLEAKFGEAGLALMPQVTAVGEPARLAAILQHARKAASVDAFRRDAGL